MWFRYGERNNTTIRNSIRCLVKDCVVYKVI